MSRTTAEKKSTAALRASAKAGQTKRKKAPRGAFFRPDGAKDVDAQGTRPRKRKRRESVGAKAAAPHKAAQVPEEEKRSDAAELPHVEEPSADGPDAKASQPSPAASLPRNPGEAANPEPRPARKRKRKRRVAAEKISKPEDKGDTDKVSAGDDEEEASLAAAKEDTSAIRKPPKLTEEAESAMRSSETAAQCEVYVEGLSFDATEEDVRAFFAPSGEVLEVRLPRYQDSGKPKGYCHVRFRTADGVARATKQDGAHMMGRYLKIEKARVSRVLQQALTGERPVQPEGCRSVFVKNLPYETNEEEVRTAFMVCGKVQDVRLARHNRTGNMKGFGYVDFLSETAAEVSGGAVRRSCAPYQHRG